MSWVYSPLIPVSAAGGLSAEVGNVAVAGVSASLTAQRRLSATTGAVTVASTAQTLTPDLRRVAVSWAEVSFGSVNYPNRLTVGAGNVSVHGIAVGLSVNPELTVATGNVNVGGGTVALNAAQNIVATLTAGAGSVVVTGGDVEMRRDYSIQVLTGNVAATGQSARVLYALPRVQVSWVEARFAIAAATIRSTTGNVSATGNAVSLDLMRRLAVTGRNVQAAAGGTTTLTPGIAARHELIAGSSNVALSGNVVSLRRSSRLSASSGGVVVAGGVAGLKFQIHPQFYPEAVFATRVYKSVATNHLSKSVTSGFGDAAGVSVSASKHITGRTGRSALFAVSVRRAA